MGTGDRPRVPPATHRSATEGSLPFFCFGAAAMAAGFYLLLSHTNVLSSRLPVSGLLVAIGLMALVGGTLAAMIGDEAEAPAGVVGASPGIPSPVSKPEALVAAPGGFTAPTMTSAAAAKAAGSGSAAPAAAPRPVVRRQIWEEDWDVDSEAFRAAASPPAPPDLVLRQIDELEQLLRQKPARRPRD